MEVEDDHENHEQEEENNHFKIIDAEPITLAPAITKYRECLRNHAVGIGRHALDGCGEFMPAGPQGTMEGLKCAACNCHRNFHRKEVVPYNNNLSSYQHLKFYPYNRIMTNSPNPSGYLQPRPPPALVAPPGCGGDDGGGGSRKRSRTKFTVEQKEKMVELAEKIGWRIGKEDEEIVERFCQETGVKRHVFKVWLHNNKHSRCKKETLVLPSP